MSRNVSSIAFFHLNSTTKSSPVVPPPALADTGPLAGMEPWRRTLVRNMYSWEHLYRLHRTDTVRSEMQKLPYDPQQGMRTAFALIFLLGILVLCMVYCRARRNCRQWSRSRRTLKRAVLSPSPFTGIAPVQRLSVLSNTPPPSSLSRSRSPSARVHIVFKPKKRSPSPLRRQSSRRKAYYYRHACNQQMHSAPQLCLPESDSSLLQSDSESSYLLLVPGHHSADDVLSASLSNREQRAFLGKPMSSGRALVRSASDSGGSTESMPSPWSSLHRTNSEASMVELQQNTVDEVVDNVVAQIHISPSPSPSPPPPSISDTVVTIPVISKVTSL